MNINALDLSAIARYFHTLCICEECASELYAEEQYDGSVKFVEMTEEELEEEHYNRIMNGRI